MRFAFLGSGSKGNSTLLEVENTCVMLDCGFSVRETERRLARLKREPADITALLVTHEHADHISGVARFARRHDITVWMTPGTLAASKQEIPNLSLFNCHETLEIQDLKIEPLPVPHDAREPCQFVFEDGVHRLGILTDTGHITAHILDRFNKCDALVVECNHDPEMLAKGPYPASLKARVGGPLGHLSNAQAAGLLSSIQRDALQHVLAVHVSEKNNRPDLACSELAQAMRCEAGWIQVVDQEAGLGWRETRQ